MRGSDGGDGVVHGVGWGKRNWRGRGGERVKSYSRHNINTIYLEFGRLSRWAFGGEHQNTIHSSTHSTCF